MSFNYNYTATTGNVKVQNVAFGMNKSKGLLTCTFDMRAYDPAGGDNIDMELTVQGKTGTADVTTPELSMPVAANVKHELIARLIREGQFPNGTIGEIDGIRVDYSDGWGMVRAHNSEDKLMLRFEADSASALRRIQEVFKLQLLACDADLQLPY